MARRKRRSHAPTFKAQVALALKGSNMLILDVRMIVALTFDSSAVRMADVLRIAAAHFTQPDRQLRPSSVHSISNDQGQLSDSIPVSEIYLTGHV